MKSLKEILKRIETIVRASEISPYLKYVSPEYSPDMGTAYGRIRFQMGKWGEEVCIKYHLKPNFEKRKKTKDEKNARTKIRQPYEKESDLVVHWNTLTDRKVSEATAALELYTKATKLASQIEYLIDNENIVDMYWKLDSPPHPTEIDRWAAYLEDHSGISGTVKDLRGKLRDLGLKVSGNKPELQHRLFSYAKQVGDVKKVEAYDEWFQNRVKAVA